MNKTKKDIINDYNKIYALHGLKAEPLHYRWIISMLGNLKSKTFLDIACGEGILLAEAGRRGALCFGLDISYEALKIARKNAPNAYLVTGDGENICFNAYFDFVTCLGSLEHYNSPEKGCREILRLLRSGGKTVIVLPNQFSMHTIFDVIRKGGPCDKGFQIIERLASYKEWKEFLEKNGFHVIKAYKVNQKPGIFRNKKIRSIKKFFRDIFYYYLTPFYLAREFAFVCKRREDE